MYNVLQFWLRNSRNSGWNLLYGNTLLVLWILFMQIKVFFQRNRLVIIDVLLLCVAWAICYVLLPTMLPIKMSKPPLTSHQDRCVKFFDTWNGILCLHFNWGVNANRFLFFYIDISLKVLLAPSVFLGVCNALVYAVGEWLITWI